MSNTSNNLFTFNFSNSPVRTAEINNQVWFLVNDVCSILEYKNPRRAIELHCKEKGVTKRYTLTKGGNQEMTYISEANLFRLIIKSKQEKAVIFEEWVMEYLLPTIRKTGSYAPTTNVTPNRELLPKMVYHNKSAHKPYRAYVYDMSLKREVSVGTFATIEEALDAQKNYFQAKAIETAHIPNHGRWLVISDADGLDVKNIDDYNCVNYKHFTRLQSDARAYADETIKLLHKVQDIVSLSHEFLYRLKVLEGDKSASRLATPLRKLIKG